MNQTVLLLLVSDCVAILSSFRTSIITLNAYDWLQTVKLVEPRRIELVNVQVSDTIKVS